MCEVDANMSAESIESAIDCIDIVGNSGQFCEKVASGEAGPVVDVNLGGLGALVGPVVDAGRGVWVTEEEEAMSALGPLGGTGGGIGELEKMTTVGKERRIEEVEGAVEVWIHRWSSGNGGNCKGICGSIDNCSNTNSSRH